MTKLTITITPDNRDTLLTRSQQLIQVAHRLEHQAASYQSEAASARIMSKRIKRAIKEYDRGQTNPDAAQKGLDPS